ncbi:MAG: nuclease [Epulopiscium sp.]|jgi:micrococcal nuclease|nr:nuclease [Candidatus Epulonipiscium sp.]
MRKRIYVLIMLLISSFTLSACQNSAQGQAEVQGAEQTSTVAVQEEDVSDGFEKVVVAQVVDGDTIRVMADGEKKTVRLIGIDTPESVHPDKSKNTVFGEEASEFTKGYLTQGQVIYLEKDTSDTDKYGRLLRYVWLEQPQDSSDKDEIQEKMFNAILISEGYANAYYYAPDTKNYELFSQLEWEAYTAQAGLWVDQGLNDESVKKKDKKQNTLDVQQEATYVGNKNSKKFHVLTCHSLPKEENAVYFDARSEALDAGYQPCSICHP